MFGVSGLRYEALTNSEGSKKRGVVAAGYALWAVVWVVAHVTGGVLVGFLLGWIGAQLPGFITREGPFLLVGGLILAGLYQLRVLQLPMPQVPRQVPRHWIVRYHWSVTALGYGLQLGSAVTTRIADASTHVTLFAALFTADPFSGAVILAAYGFARSLPAVFVGPFADSPQRSLMWAIRLEDSEPVFARISGVMLLLSALALLAMAWDLPYLS